MLSIDEAIETLKYDIEIDMYIHDIAPQLAEWLEELKAIKSDEFTDNLLNMGFTKGYNKAIDDFAILMKEAINQDWTTTYSYGPITYNRLFDKCNEIAELLREGIKE